VSSFLTAHQHKEGHLLPLHITDEQQVKSK